MGLEDLTGSTKYLDDLDKANPVGTTDEVSTADDHIRGIKNVLKNTFPNVDGIVTLTVAEFNLLSGLVDMNYLRSDVADTMEGNLTLDKAVAEKAVSLGTGGAISINTSLGSLFYTGTLASIPVFTFTNAAASGYVSAFTLELYNALNYAPDWTAQTVEWAGNGAEPVWTAGKDLVSFYTRDNGTTWVGTPGGLDFA